MKKKKIQYDVNREAAKNQHCCLVKLANMNILLEKKNYLLIKIELQKKLSLQILLSVRHFKKQINKIEVMVKSK